MFEVIECLSGKCVSKKTNLLLMKFNGNTRNIVWPLIWPLSAFGAGFYEWRYDNIYVLPIKGLGVVIVRSNGNKNRFIPSIISITRHDAIKGLIQETCSGRLMIHIFLVNHLFWMFVLRSIFFPHATCYMFRRVIICLLFLVRLFSQRIFIGKEYRRDAKKRFSETRECKFQAKNENSKKR